MVLEDRKIAYGFLISKQDVVCANPFGILEYDVFSGHRMQKALIAVTLRCHAWII